MNYGQVSPGYGMQQPMQPQQITVVLQQEPIIQQPVQEEVQQVKLKGKPQNLQCPRCNKMVSVIMLTSVIMLKSMV